MTCPFCLGPIALPDPRESAFCEECDLEFVPTEDIGWFGESIVLYVWQP